MINIYKFTCLENMKGYVGQDSTGHRIQDHFRCASEGCFNCGGSSALHAAIRKHGEENFEIEILESTEGNANELEDAYILQEKCLFPDGYNLKLNASYSRPFERNSHGILDYISPVEKHREGFQTIKIGATLHAERMLKLPEWALDNEKVQTLLLGAFSKLKIDEKQRVQAGRWARIIYLYYRAGETYLSIAEQLREKPEAIKNAIRMIGNVASGKSTKGGERKTRGRPKKIVF